MLLEREECVETVRNGNPLASPYPVTLAATGAEIGTADEPTEAEGEG